MTLKELRIQKGLTQKECANYLGISLRSYINYEQDKNKESTFKYSIYLFSLNKYGKELELSDSKVYNTNVVTGTLLNNLVKKVKDYKKRECYKDLKKYINNNYIGKICVLYGLRRTGKTTMLFQMINELPIDKTAYIKVKTTDNMADLTKDLSLLFDKGYKYIFIDEITLLEDFINTAATLSDIYASTGMKIVLSGTDSLGFMMASEEELYDRAILIHTSFISFSEYARVLGLSSIDKYIEYGGTFKIENMDFDDPDSALDEVSFKDDESARKYIDSSISRNIQHTLKNNHYGQYFNHLKDLYDKGELTNVINRIVENMNHEFVLNTIIERFKSHDLGSSKDLMLHEAPKSKAYILYNIDKAKVIERLKNLISIKEKEELKVKINKEHVAQIKKYLIMLDLLVNCPDIIDDNKPIDHYLFTQPGMRYAIAKALVYSLKQDKYFVSNSFNDRNYIIDKILEDVKGRMLEEIVLLETNKALNKSYKAFKYKFSKGGEIDMVVINKDNDTCDIYEIKHSKEINNDQYKHLIDKDKRHDIAYRFGKIKNKYVLYRGKYKKLPKGIIYLNVEDYLKNLYK